MQPLRSKFKMLYMNMGHGDTIFTSAIQNRLTENGFVWLRRGSSPRELIGSLNRHLG
jgi:hypothetical protein